MNSNDKKKTQVSSTSSLSKEKELVGSTEPYIKDLSREEEISTEVKEMGVTQKKENIEVPPDLQQFGVRTSGFSTTVPYKPTLHLPITDEKIEEGLHASILSSLRWLSEWCKFQLRRLHLALKVIHGRVMRVRFHNE